MLLIRPLTACGFIKPQFITYFQHKISIEIQKKRKIIEPVLNQYQSNTIQYASALYIYYYQDQQKMVQISSW